MALTSDEESKVKQIITAFENGKRLSDLPEATGTNPFGMYTEVLDTDGESKKAALARCSRILKNSAPTASSSTRP